jgi:hypothetical protein
MDFKEDVTNWRLVSDFFFRQEIEVEQEYQDKLISRFQRNKRISNIRKDWKESMTLNNPFLKRNNLLRKVSDGLL